MPSGYKPNFSVQAAGTDVTNRFADRLLGIVIELSSGGGAGDSMEIVIDDRGFNVAEPQIKDRLDIYLGYEGVGLEFMGSFEVNSVRYSFPPRTITVRGTTASGLNDLKTQSVQSFEGKTIEQILAEAGSTIGIKVKVHPSIADQKIPFLNSTTSFGSLIAKLESQYDAVAKIADGRLTLTPRSGGSSVSGFALPIFVLRDYSFADLEVTKETRGEFAKSVASYRDKETNKTETVDAKSARDALDSTAAHTIGKLFNTKEEAEAAAKSAQAQLDRSGEKINATLAEGDPWVRDGQRIVVSGIRSGIDGSYTLDIVRHSYSKVSGIRTAFSGTGGVNGLAAEFQSSTASPGTQGAFIAPGPGEFFGHFIPEAQNLLDRSFGAVPSFVGSSPPPMQ